MVTSESVYRSRRTFLKSLGYGLGGSVFSPSYLNGANIGFSTELNPLYVLKELDLTPYNLITSYNNFFEFSTDKEGPKKLANKGWNSEPWMIEVRGLVRNPIKMDVNALIKIIWPNPFVLSNTDHGDTTNIRACRKVMHHVSYYWVCRHEII